jgi:hypothetical protein
VPINIVMVYIRSKKVKGKTYYYIVEGNLDKSGNVKQKVIMYLGNAKHILEVFDFYKKHYKK